MSLGSTNQKLGQVRFLNAWYYADGKFAITMCFFRPFSMKEQCLESKWWTLFMLCFIWGKLEHQQLLCSSRQPVLHKERSAVSQGHNTKIFVNRISSFHLTTQDTKVVTNPTLFMTSDWKEVHHHKIHRYFCWSCFQSYLESLQCYSYSLANDKGLLC